MRYVIVGNSAAGIKAAETIRSLDREGSLTIVSDEAFPAYSRCLLPSFLEGRLSEEQLSIRSRDFYTANKIEAILGVKAEKVLPASKELLLDNGRKVSYDRLLIATGSSTDFPPVPGLGDGTGGVYGLRTIDDARAILKAAQDARRAIVIGAGFVGLEVACALCRRGLEVTVAERFLQILPQQFDARAAAVLERDLKAGGISFLLGVQVERVMEQSRRSRLMDRNVREVLLKDGDRLQADLVVVATGTRPNTSLVKEAGLRVNHGIAVGRYLETSQPDIYAAGDVAESIDLVTGQPGLSPIWPNAVFQGRIAGYNMTGRRRECGALVSLQNAVEFRQVPAIAVGLTRPPENDARFEVLSRYEPARAVYKKLVLQNNVLVGIILVGEIQQAGIYSALIRKRANLGRLKKRLLRQDFACADLLGLPA